MIDQPRWKVVEYSRSKIINAGRVIRQDNKDSVEYREAISIVDNWRAAHSFPLHIIYMHLRRICIGSDVIVAERLKRLDSIVKKIIREKSMNLWTMQDLGGCRVIVQSISDVYSYALKYENSRKRHIKKKEYDYIKNPKISGYRSLHVVYEYHSDRVDTYNQNMLIEIQYRTHLQHLWATAVEAMGLFTKNSIKSGNGSDEVKRFFVLISALFAYTEKQPLPPNVSDNINNIITELQLIDSKCNYLAFLSGIRIAVEYKKEIKNDDGYCILILNYATRRLQIKQFKSSEVDDANKVYSAIENMRSSLKIDAVLVRVTSFKELKKAYPNYFNDIGEFVDKVKAYF